MHSNQCCLYLCATCICMHGNNTCVTKAQLKIKIRLSGPLRKPNFPLCSKIRDRSGLWQKKHLKKHPSKEKKHPFCKQKALLEQKKTLSKHYLLTKSNNDGEKKFYFHPNFF